MDGGETRGAAKDPTMRRTAAAVQKYLAACDDEAKVEEPRI